MAAGGELPGRDHVIDGPPPPGALTVLVDVGRQKNYAVFGGSLVTFPIAMVLPSSRKVNRPNWDTLVNVSTQMGFSTFIRQFTMLLLLTYFTCPINITSCQSSGEQTTR